MRVANLTDQWICSCGNWVDREISWCPTCCEESDAKIPEVVERAKESLKSTILALE